MGGSLALLIVVEISLRFAYGFGKMPLYATSDKYEYMALLNQSGVRLGNRYYFNAFGMRSDEVHPHKKHILGLGDSVIYGGVQTDQDSLATSLFSVETGMQMLNISLLEVGDLITVQLISRKRECLKLGGSSYW